MSVIYEVKEGWSTMTKKIKEEEGGVTKYEIINRPRADLLDP